MVNLTYQQYNTIIDKILEAIDEVKDFDPNETYRFMQIDIIELLSDVLVILEDITVLGNEVQQHKSELNMEDIKNGEALGNKEAEVNSKEVKEKGNSKEGKAEVVATIAPEAANEASEPSVA